MLHGTTVGLAVGVATVLAAIYGVGAFVTRYPDDPTDRQLLTALVGFPAMLFVSVQPLLALARGHPEALGAFDWLGVIGVVGFAGLVVAAVRPRLGR